MTKPDCVELRRAGAIPASAVAPPVSTPAIPVSAGVVVGPRCSEDPLPAVPSSVVAPSSPAAPGIGGGAKASVVGPALACPDCVGICRAVAVSVSVVVRLVLIPRWALPVSVAVVAGLASAYPDCVGFCRAVAVSFSVVVRLVWLPGYRGFFMGPSAR